MSNGLSRDWLDQHFAQQYQERNPSDIVEEQKHQRREHFISEHQVDALLPSLEEGDEEEEGEDEVEVDVVMDPSSLEESLHQEPVYDIPVEEESKVPKKEVPKKKGGDDEEFKEPPYQPTQEERRDAIRNVQLVNTFKVVSIGHWCDLIERHYPALPVEHQDEIK